MGYPIIHTNFWDAVIAVPVVMILTQAIKVFFPIQPKFVPAIALALGAIGNYASLKTTIRSFQNKTKKE